MQIPLCMSLFLVSYFLSVTVSCQTLRVPQISILVFSSFYSTYSSLGCDLVLLLQPSLYAGISEVCLSNPYWSSLCSRFIVSALSPMTETQGKSITMAKGIQKYDKEEMLIQLVLCGLIVI